MIVAKSLTVATCEHGTATLRLHDESGEIVAVAAMTADVAVELTDDICNQVEDYLAGKLDPCAGHA